MTKCLDSKGWRDVWTAEDLDNIANRIDQAKKGSGCSLTDTMEILEILEQLEWMRITFPPSHQSYFVETKDELIGVAISHLERLRSELPV